MHDIQGSKYRVHTCTSAGTFPKVQVHFALYLHCVQVACPTIKRYSYIVYYSHACNSATSSASDCKYKYTFTKQYDQNG